MIMRGVSCLRGAPPFYSAKAWTIEHRSLACNLSSRGAASVRIATLLRKPDALKVEVDVSYVGFDIPNEFVVGYGLDYAERYRNLSFIGTLRPEVYHH